MSDTKRFHPIYILSILYALFLYCYTVLFFSSVNFDIEYLLAVPIAFLIIEIIICTVFKNRISKTQALTAAVIIKYSLIPFFLVGGAFTAIMFLFPTGGMVIALPITGWIIMVCGSPFAITYYIKAHKENSSLSPLKIFGIVCQFFFSADVFAVMISSIREKHFKKLSLALIIITAVIIFIFVSILIISVFVGSVALIFESVSEKLCFKV